MKQYKLLAEQWINGIQRSAGDIVRMLDAEAKYLKHVLEEMVVKASPAAAPVAAPEVEADPVVEAAPDEAPMLGAVVEEQPVESNGKRRRQ